MVETPCVVGASPEAHGCTCAAEDTMKVAMRRVLITGSTRGIGRALAAHFRELGDTVCGVARSGDVSFAADLAKEGGLIAARAFSEMGGLDVVIHCAGMFDALDPVDLARLVLTNVLGT